MSAQANQNQSPTFVQSLSTEHSINDSALPSDDSLLNGGPQDECNAFSDSACMTGKSQTLTQSHTDAEMLHIAASSLSTHDVSPMASLPSLINAYASHDFNKIESCSPNFNMLDNKHAQQQSHLSELNTPNTTQFSCSPYLNEITCNTNAYYDYDYASSNSGNNSGTNISQMAQPKSSPFYVYHNQQQQQTYNDYATSNNMGSMASPPQSFYSNYPYVYDPSQGYSNMTGLCNLKLSTLNSFTRNPRC